MKPDTFYFSHDYNARNDRKMIKLRLKLKMEGVGIYWSLVEMLYEEGGKIPFSDIPTIAHELRVKQGVIEQLLTGFELFENDGNIFWSNSVKRRLNKRLEKSEKAKASASHRWQNANGMRTQNEGNAIKERKGKERKIKERKLLLPASPETTKKFYDEQIANLNGHVSSDSYRQLVEFLYGKNQKKEDYKNVLSMQEQISFKQFLSMKETAEKTGVTIKEILNEMENRTNLSKNNISASATAMNWMRRNAERKK